MGVLCAHRPPNTLRAQMGSKRVQRCGRGFVRGTMGFRSEDVLSLLSRGQFMNEIAKQIAIFVFFYGLSGTFVAFLVSLSGLIDFSIVTTVGAAVIFRIVTYFFLRGAS